MQNQARIILSAKRRSGRAAASVLKLFLVALAFLVAGNGWAEWRPAVRLASNNSPADTPAGWYYRDASGQWQPLDGGAFRPAHQGSLVNLSATEALTFSGLAPGNYTFYFGVDARDGVLDTATVWCASIHLTVY